MITIAIGADHRGVEHKENIKKHAGTNIAWHDVGSYDEQVTDYPLFAASVATCIQQKVVTKGVLICGSGIGMTIAANRFAHVYAALAWNEEVARLSVEDDNANVLVIPALFVSCEQTLQLVSVWLAACFKQHRYAERIAMIDALGGVDRTRSV